MWSVEGKAVVHQSGLSIEVTDGSFSNPMDLAIKGDKGLSAPELASMIREGIHYAMNNAVSRETKLDHARSVKKTSNRPILKLKKK